MEGSGQCEVCKAKRNGGGQRTKQRKRAAASLHICISCLKAEAMPGRKMCGYCREYHDDAARKYRAKGIANGKCHTCGANDPVPGHVRCAKCIATSKKAKARYKARLAASQTGRTIQ